MSNVKDARSGLKPENIQEVLDAEKDSAKWATLAGQQQYSTPEWLAIEATNKLPIKQAQTRIDPQCAMGNLINYRQTNWPYSFGIELDNRIDRSKVPWAHLITIDCQKAFEIVDDIYPTLRFETFNANPPFAKRWSVGEEIVDSTKWTWDRALKHGCQGVFITNHNTAVKLGIDKHPFVVDYKTYSDVWKQCEVVIGVAVWHNPDAEPTNLSEVIDAWGQIEKIVQEEKSKRSPFNIWMRHDGKLATYLSTRSQAKFKLTRDHILQLERIKDSHPLALTTERETRKLLNELITCGFYTIEPKALKAIKEALAQVAMAVPIMPITDFERVAYADEEDHLLCVNSCGMDFTPGRKYELRTASYIFVEGFKRDKVRFDEETQQTFTAKHDCTLSGQDRYIAFTDDQGIERRFMDKPRKECQNEHDENLLWQIFQKPVVKTIADVSPEKVATNLKLLRTCEMLAGYEYYPGQMEYLSRYLVKDYGLCAAAVGTGKTLMAITLIAAKAPSRALICAPQGTMKSSGDEEDDEDYQASQWIQELRQFAPYLQVFELFSMADFFRIRDLNDGELPPGVYVTYYEALFQNKARESCPETWTDEKLKAKYPALPVKVNNEAPRALCSSIGEEREGIRCIMDPSMATQIGSLFDMVLLDEAHKCCHMTANMSQIMIRLQPKYRYALTATPIPNVISDMFNLMGWLCVEDWYKGDRRNPNWPYAREEKGRFEGTFMSKERDHTEEGLRKAADPEWNGKVEKTSPVISSPARLLKIIRPTLAFISKEQVNPKYRTAKLVDVRVPMGRQQARLYGHFLNRANIPCGHPLIRARKQIAYLRAIAADPAGFDHHTATSPTVLSNFNPKMIAMLELVAEILGRGEQVVILNARIGQTNEIARRLMECGINFSRIDSTVPPQQHAYQSGLFKEKKTMVHLMGIKCAVGHSYPECPNMIIGSLEYSYGSFEQGKGRVDRVNSRLPATIYCVLNSCSLEELMYDVVATKEDAAVICLRGKRMPRQFKPVDMSEILAQSMTKFTENGTADEMDLEGKWAVLRAKLKNASKPLAKAA